MEAWGQRRYLGSLAWLSALALQSQPGEETIVSEPWCLGLGRASLRSSSAPSLRKPTEK